jgi:fermentation-respiration switch protein FrsA (DUF1100 family)
MVFLWIILVYIGVLAFFYVYQRSMVFRPSMDDPFSHSNRPFRPFLYQTPEGLRLKGLWHPATCEDRPTIIYFHGTAGNIEDRIYKAKLFKARGYGIALVGYHGYDGNPGIPTEQNLYDDGRAAIRAIYKKGVPEEKMVLYGESLGTGIATQMAAEHPDILALILEAPYTSIPDVAASRHWYFPVRPLIKDRFETFKKIATLKMPILIVHGTRDRTVPYRFGRKLFELVTTKRKEFVTLEGAGHTNLYEFKAEEAVHAFLTSLDK